MKLNRLVHVVLIGPLLWACGSDDQSDGGATGGAAGSGGSGGMLPSGSGGTSAAGGSGGAGASPGTGGSTPSSGGSAGTEPLAAAPAKKRIAAGRRHACAVTDTRGIACWGAGLDPVDDAPQDTGYEMVVAGSENSCALRTDGTAVCWGNIPAPPEDAFIDISIRGSACGITAADGQILCWPDTAVPSDAPVGSEGGFARVGRSGSLCALRIDGTAQCWASTSTSELVQNVPSGSFIDLSIGQSDACTLTSTGTGHCWGSLVALDLQLSGRSYHQIVPGFSAICAILPDRTAQCWGEGFVVENPPPAGVAFVEISVGQDIACGIATNGDVHCWGNDMLPGLDQKPPGLKALVD